MEQPRAITLNPRARMTGTFYLFYFLTAILGAYLSSHKFAFWGYTVNAISLALYVVVSLLFYCLFKPVNKFLSLIALLFSLCGCILMTLGLFHITAHDIISPLAFFGLFCMLIGYLILKSTFLPKIIGGVMVLAGMGWLIILTPLANYLSVYIKSIGILAEASLMLWLIAMGVNVQRWKEQAVGKKVEKSSPATGVKRQESSG